MSVSYTHLDVYKRQAYYLCIPATNDKEWQPSWSRLPSVEINGNEIVVKDVRSFIYRT